jgi:hypothetical protein
MTASASSTAVIRASFSVTTIVLGSLAVYETIGARFSRYGYLFSGLLAC